MKQVHQTFEQWGKEFLDETDIMFLTGVARQLSLDDANKLERLSELVYGDKEAVHEVLNILEIESIVRMYGMGRSVTEISELLGDRDNKHVLTQLYLTNKIRPGDLDSYWASDYDFVQDVFNSAAPEDRDKEYITKEQIIQELVEYMNERAEEEDYEVPSGTNSFYLVHLQHRVKNYIDNYRTRVTTDDILEIALTVIKTMN